MLTDEYPDNHRLVTTEQDNALETEVVARPRTVDLSKLLPPEILANIFGHLTLQDKGRSAQVCKTWRAALYHKSLWNDVEARLHLHLLPRNPHLFVSLTARGIRRVQVLSCDTCLCDLVADMPDLQSLDFSVCSRNLTNLELVSAVGHHPLPHLTRLNLDNCNQVTDDSVIALTETCANLTDLDLTSCSKLTDKSLLHVGRRLTALTRLVIDHCAFTDVGIAYLTRLVPEEPISLNVKLEHLSLNCCRQLTDEALQLVADRLPVLRFLDITKLTKVTEAGFRQLARLVNLWELKASELNIKDAWLAHLMNMGIRKLDVSRNDGLTEQGLAHLGRMNWLRQLNMAFFQGETGFNFLAESNVATLYMSNCDNLTDAGLDQLARMANLSKLDLGYCTGISDLGLFSLANGVTKLTSLDLTFNDQITDVGLQYLSRLPLRELHLKYCTKVTRTGIGHLVRMIDLRKLDLTGCKVTDAGLAVLAEGAANMAVLKLADCQEITGTGLLYLAMMTNLRDVDLRKCRGITSADVIVLARRAPKIANIELRNCF